MLAICWDHWCPKTWPRIFPFEIFLFFFLVLTGFLITGSLLRQRTRSEELGKAWRYDALKTYQIRRGLRILAPYYAALGLALLVLAPDALAGREADIWSGLGWYVFHLSNIHMALIGHWPSGTNHFWSLAIQQQFYLIWPFIIWFIPRKYLLPAIIVFTAIGPISRYQHDYFLSWFAWPQVLTWSAFDYFGTGAVLALLHHRGMALNSPVVRWLSALSLAIYVGIFCSHSLGFQTYGIRPLQQTFLSIGLCGIIGAGTVGFSGKFGKFFELPMLQRIGEVSYGIYLFHNLAPLVAGKIFFFLWADVFQNFWGEVLRILLFAAVTWALTLASWRWIEQPLQRVRSKITPR